VAMGKISGQAAAINLISGLGVYFLKNGQSSPFLNVKKSFRYRSVQESQKSLEKC